MGDPQAGPFTLTLGGLTVGRTYAFQFFVTATATALTQTTATAGNNVVLLSNTTFVNGGVGQFAIGTFTATSSSQVITYSSGFQPTINAAQLRDITTIREPGTWALLGTGLAGRGVVARRRRTHV